MPEKANRDSAFVLLALRGAGVATQVLAQISVGFLAGAGALGMLQICQTWTALLGEVIGKGTPVRAMRSLAITREPSARRQWLGSACREVLTLWLMLLVGGFLVFGLFPSTLPGSANAASLIAVAASVAGIQALFRIAIEGLKGLGVARTAVGLECLLPPISLAIAVVGLAVSGRTGELLLAAYAGSLALALVFAWRALLRRVGPCQLAGRLRVDPDQRALWGAGILNMVFLGFPLLAWPGAEFASAGAFALAYKQVNVATTILVALAASFGPTFAAAAAEGDRAKLAATLARSQRVSLLAFLPLIALLLAVAPLLAALLGPEFGDATKFLFILGVGHLVNAATGLPGLLLNMAGRGEIELRITAGCLAVALPIALLVDLSPTALAGLYAGAIAVKNLLAYGAARVLLRDDAFTARLATT